MPCIDYAWCIHFPILILSLFYYFSSPSAFFYYLFGHILANYAARVRPIYFGIYLPTKSHRRINQGILSILGLCRKHIYFLWIYFLWYDSLSFAPFAFCFACYLRATFLVGWPKHRERYWITRPDALSTLDFNNILCIFFYFNTKMSKSCPPNWHVK